jgi:tRNA-dihydrouridine synthase A
MPTERPAAPALAHRFCVAPMMDWTDRHCRFFLRQFSRRALLYTEMVTTGALIHGDLQRHLDFDPEEQPLALQIGGSEPDELARAAHLGERWGYREINLNCGCPSERVQRGAFGACLMAEPALVADCVRAMQDAVSVPITVKHRLGLDRDTDYGFVHRFVATVASAGCRTFVVHARNAWLKGLSPKENRDVPPLRYADAYRLKRDFPDLEVVINGGFQALAPALAQLRHVDGVMVGRAAYHHPTLLAGVDAAFYDDDRLVPSRAEVAERMFAYARAKVTEGVPLRAITRHLIGLYHGQPGARAWRRMLSDPARLGANDPALIVEAMEVAEAGPCARTSVFDLQATEG